jgi:hypothetical protein
MTRFTAGGIETPSGGPKLEPRVCSPDEMTHFITELARDWWTDSSTCLASPLPRPCPEADTVAGFPSLTVLWNSVIQITHSSSL